MDLTIHTKSFGRLDVQTNQQDPQLLVRDSESESYKPEPKGERYYQIVAQLRPELVPPRQGHDAIRELQQSIKEVRRETRSLDKQLGRYRELSNDRMRRVRNNFDDEGIHDFTRITRATARDPYMGVWRRKQQECADTLDRKRSVLKGLTREMVATKTRRAAEPPPTFSWSVVWAGLFGEDDPMK